MGRSRRDWTQDKFERYIKEGRGQGSGSNYQPWIKIQDFPSKGRVSRPPGWKTNREHHLLSDHERRMFYVFEWSDVVIDTREQFPLLDLDLIMSIAEDMGFKYPKDPNSDTPYILTTDFMLSVKENGKNVQKARTVKQVKDISSTSVANKFELERRYYAAKDIDWGIITEKEIPRLLAENVEWVHSAYKLEATNEINIEELRDIAQILKSRLQESDTTINRVTTSLDKEMNLESGTSLYIFKHLIARKEILMDMLGTKISSCPSTTVIQKIVF
ncbi:MAG: TnsA endonuclease C-terminal domain-containing protein [Dolichospermum sp. DET50]|nr:TnsA endonuclease C-terminal domain-containing protein [Dolichospermum sp. DET66]MBS3032147.1 TnsA endonuclease C-terminal domain-containing protein [Dolichospermum sp. DET67]MBS3037351.1 TnsA endonuclease C-terminal domain-containing protein [Dolichospermum sp. DET50]QSX69338.1 MAG: heteromeric transposase endonuclease subunit TnsA [Dolichospermum sp. DET69]